MFLYIYEVFYMLHFDVVSSIRRFRRFFPPLLASIARSSGATSATPGGAAPPPCRRRQTSTNGTWTEHEVLHVIRKAIRKVIRKVLQVIIEILSLFNTIWNKRPGCTQNWEFAKVFILQTHDDCLCLTHQIWRQQIPEGWLQLTPRSNASIRCRSQNTSPLDLCLHMTSVFQSCSWLEDLQVIKKT